MDVDRATSRDARSWLDLAAEVEALFGPLRDNPAFHRALQRHLARGTAFCVRAGDGPPGAPLCGGLLFAPPGPARPAYRIGWLAVAARCRRRGVGRRLVEHACGLVTPPATLAVVTFGDDVAAGQPARRLYEQLGFRPAEAAPRGPEGGARQVYRRTFPAPPGAQAAPRRGRGARRGPAFASVGLAAPRLDTPDDRESQHHMAGFVPATWIASVQYFQKSRELELQNTMPLRQWYGALAYPRGEAAPSWRSRPSVSTWDQTSTICPLQQR